MSTKIGRGAVLLAVLCLLINRQSTIRAQDTVQPIYTDIAAGEIDWSTDSRFVAFFNGGVPVVLTTDNNWKEYDTQTKTLTESDLWPFQPTLTIKEQQTFKPTKEEGTSQVSVSPNGRYILYAGKGVYESEGAYWPLMLGDQLTRQIVNLTKNTPLVVYSPFGGTQFFSIIWNHASTAFVISQLLDNLPSGFAYVSNIHPGFSHPAIKKLDQVQIGSQGYDSVRVYDISADDSQILLRTGKNAPGIDVYSEVPALLIYNLADPSKTVELSAVGADHLATAGFIAGNPRKLLVVNESGVVRYDLNAGTKTILNSMIKADTAFNVRFSPNGAWLALSQGGYFYVINLVS